MSYGIKYKEYEKEDYKDKPELWDRKKKKDECGKIEIKAENVYIYIKCDECEKEKREY